MGLILNYNFSDIENATVFIVYIVDQLAEEFEIEKNNIIDVQIREGSVIVEFKLIGDDEDINVEDVAAMMVNRLPTFVFMFNNQSIPVISVDDPVIIYRPETMTTDSPKSLSTGAIVGIVVGTIVVIALIVVIAVLIIHSISKKKKNKVSGEQDTEALQLADTETI
ncbi:uncharacterized protein [Antedon mediterranea]|uniref:uncharacterized protein n=1 Tax=Antedon mediterranea TaxID=105859 RepID=UPI003AF6436D